MTEDKKNSLKELINENSKLLADLENKICKQAMAKVRGQLNYFISQLSRDFEDKVYLYMRQILAQGTFKNLLPDEQYIYIYLQTMLINNELAKEIKK